MDIDSYHAEVLPEDKADYVMKLKKRGTVMMVGDGIMRLIHQNFTATITVNSAAMLLGALGVITPLWAAVIHNTATLAVVLNSARILAPKQKKMLA